MAENPPKTEKPPEKKEKVPNLPMPMKKLKGTPQEAVARNWLEQEKRGLIYLCKESGCYHPLIHVKDVNNRIVVKTENDDTRFVMTCTWDPDHGSKILLADGYRVNVNGKDSGGSVNGQLVKPFKKNDDLD